MAKDPNPQLNETAEETWNRIESQLASSEGGEVEAEPTTPEESPPAEDALETTEPDEADSEEPEEQPEPEPPADITPEGQELLELKKLAKKHNLKVEDGKVTSHEIAGFREWKRKQKAGVEQWAAGIKQQVQQEIQQAYDQANEKLQFAERVHAAREAQDLDEFAKIAGFEDWNAAQKHKAAQIADPAHKELQELKRWQRDQQAQQAKQQQQAQAQAAEAERQKAIGEYIKGLQHQMSNSDDREIKVLSQDPTFVRAVYVIQNQHWDGSTTVAPEQAARMAAQGGPTLLDEVRAKYKVMHEAFGQKEAEAMVKEAKKAEPAEKPKAPKSAPLGAKRGVEPTAGRRPWKTAQEFDRYAAQMMRDAEQAERKNSS